jgi:polysaccharide pyruvyl transferase WcaK-like protein
VTSFSSHSSRPLESGFLARPGIRAFQIANGLGAGNIGDELMARAFWGRIDSAIHLEVPLLSEYSRQHEPYPPGYHYLPVDFDAPESPAEGVGLGLLVGDTPVTEREGLGWPLGFLGPRLRTFHERGIPVHAVGTGIDQLDSAPALSLFREAFLPIRSWTVRSPRCRQALLSMGVPTELIAVGADWAWLYRSKADRSSWANELLVRIGLDPSRPLIAVNVLNLIWKEDDRYKHALAEALTLLSQQHGLQAFFFCNECRDGDLFDAAAARHVASLMPSPPPMVPNLYYSPDEALALIGRAQLTISFRYHFTVQSILARAIPITVVRSQKMAGLVEELGIPLSCPIEDLTAGQLVNLVRDGLTRREFYTTQLMKRRAVLTARAEANLQFLPELAPHSLSGPDGSSCGAPDTG